MCEILTLGKDTAWRRIDKVPPSGKYYKEKHGSVCVNGSIYWMDYENSATILVAFDVGREEYRIISNLDFLSYRESGLDFISSRVSFYLMELDGHLAIKKNTGDHNVNLWILDDECDKNISTRNTSNIKWTKEIITLPLDRSNSNIRFQVVGGTEYLILECYGGYYEPPVWVHCYNRENKTFSRIKITGDGSPISLLGAYIGHPFHMFTTYVESLLALQRSHRPSMKAPDTSSTK
ncbi:putative F-box protein At1g46840 [Papaver somniferum]|uniref:putative F-box protein At1g46840 n=1 Tax=Papaver somniferum TaxID=3469 RepID=UPI000E7010B8|nr:putative F-box protein At1g46840 [Papaver somniferum]